ncbi:transcriptional corepressor for histone genes (Hir3) [Coccidioides immitis RS]|uniref:Histone transcription regulator 3 homolog n=2 Tax=Coccidioides immitis TaxID=5501 RepID=A0A0E1S2T2_COCIM|nr:transcriptional corepressor for histone genes (Hir3) [Coccidioides immitis RS]EAS32430.1 transcriptional corepressor for histone genes (Hir3) [Coccidioides immitis RS]KMP07665.1 hypothetical protein CIRG_07346 [Coccidioides immitis RMSCC 2394]
MSTFVALNVEPAEDIEDVDDTKEIQIEEALKLYQNALKLHSQGPEYYDQAQEAYNALFESEIFKYPEATSEYKRDQILGLDDDDFYFPDEIAEGDSAPDAINTTSSALPQTIFLSYKNHAQFLLDHLKVLLDKREKQDDIHVSNQIKEALEHFAEALERDETDMELWRKSSRVGNALKSHRIARFCLESVLEGDGYGVEDRLGQPGLEQVFAARDLHEILRTLQDKVSSAQLPLRQPRKGISRLLAKQADLYPFLPRHSKETRSCSAPHQSDGNKTRHRLATSASNTWTDVGSAILRALAEESQTDDSIWSPVTLRIQLPRNSCFVELPIIQQNKIGDFTEVRLDDDDDIELPDRENGEPVTTAEKPSSKSPKRESDLDDEQSTEKNTDENAKDNTDKAEQANEKSAEQDGDGPLTPPAADANVKVHGPQSRKRSSTSVGNEEPTDGGRAKSRRIRARESIAEAQAHQDEIVFDQTKYFEDRLEHFAHADQWMFSTSGALLSKLGVEELGTIDEMRHAIDQTDGHTSPRGSFHEPSLESVSMRDLREAIENWSGAQNLKDDIFTSHDGLAGVKQSGLNIFLERSRQAQPALSQKESYFDDEGLSQFVESVNSENFHPQKVAFKWLECHFTSDLSSSLNTTTSSNLQPSSAYATQHWSDRKKSLIKDLIVRNDEFTYKHFLSSACDFTQTSPAGNGPSAEMAQSLYELHLDIFASMCSPNSDSDESYKALQRDRLRRWESLARRLINHQVKIGDKSDFQTGNIFRHLWATIMSFNLTAGADREYVLACLNDLKSVFTSFGEPVLTLVNNATMPELSISAVEQEIARISSMEFFMKVFGPGKEDPVSLIENIEPILDPSAIEHHPPELAEDQVTNLLNVPAEIQRAQDLAFFLDRGDVTLKLFLWRRLQKAYESIQYPTKVISCSLRSIEIIVGELVAPTYLELPSNQRQETLLRWLNRADYLMLNVIGKILDDPKSSFECIDMSHLQSSMSAIARLSRLLHSFVLYEDSVRIGQTSPPEIRPAAAAKAYDHYKEKLRSMLVRSWTLQYTLIKEGIAQNKELFDMPSDDCINYLRSVHNALGIRSYCRYANKVLLKVMKQELLTLDAEDSYESDVAQVLFDYYGLKFSPELDISLDHGCPVEKLDRPTALMMVDFAMLQAKRMNIKDFLKSDLKSTIDTIQMSIGWSGRIYPAITQNKRIISAFLKSPINPAILYRAVQGVSDVSVVPVHTESYRLAENGWYFLLGLAAFTKFKTQKRLGPTATDDLDLAATFFRRELEHGVDRWETWYRLGQVYDAKLEEDITWSAEKLNHHRADLTLLERRAIHSYSMAIALAIRTADSSAETKKTISDLYTQFGFRIYASSREPFSMAAFSLDDFTRHFSSDKSQQMYTGKPFRDMKLYSTWYFASYLFQKAMVDRPMNWINHYMFSKCLWKMFTSQDPLKERYKPIEVEDILDSLDAAIEALPKKRDSRSDPILEPHFKLASIIHKLVKRGDLDPCNASERLIATPWGRKLSPVEDLAGWKPFILNVLKNLGTADKSNWHHRIVARAAHVIYDDTRDVEAAAAAKHELSQHIFTKTMTLQVWRPENERPGRHFVYTSRYVYFFVHIMDQLNDRTGLDLLLRRVRRKPNDYVNYTKLWEDICLTYIKLFRRLGHVPASHEEAIFKPLGHEEFVANATRLDSWTHSETAEPALIDLVREAVELKKLNGGLIKPGIFEDLVGDVYALIYEKTVPGILERIAKEENRERMKVDHLLSAGDSVNDNHTPPPGLDKSPDKPPEKAPGPKARAKGVTRREVQRKADAIATKAAASRPKPIRPADEDSKPVVVEQAATEGTANKAEAQEEVSKPVSQQTPEAGEATGPAIVPSSALPSIHDSGEDESELSELDDSKMSDPSKPSLPMFPNLLVKRLASPNPMSELSSNISHDGRETGGDVDVDGGPDGEGDGEGDSNSEGDGDGEGEGEGEGEGDAEGEAEEEGDGEGDDNDGESAQTISVPDNKSEPGVVDKKPGRTDDARKSDHSDVDMEGT